MSKGIGNREVRRVPKDWQHPKDASGRYVPLFDGVDLDRRQAMWDEGARKWSQGLRRDHRGGWQPIDDDAKSLTFGEWDSHRPDPRAHMPQWSQEERTHIMLYECTSEGTPLSPAFESPEELARWLVDNNVSVFAKSTASYEAWLSLITQDIESSAVHEDGLLVSAKP